MKLMLFLFIAATCLSSTLFSQSMAINTDGSIADASAILDVKSGVKGMLIPRTSTSSRLAIINPAKGLILYDTTASAFYFYDGLIWNALSGNSNSWSLTGNAGTNPATQFIGTIDNKPLHFRINNINAGIIDTTSFNTATGFRTLDSITTGVHNTSFGYKALLRNAGGDYNTALGSNALRQNTAGAFNTAVGMQSLTSNISGFGNTAVGHTSMALNTFGYANTANGYAALYSNTTGIDNTADGFQALYYNTTGNYNSAHGLGALFYNTTGNNNVAVGFEALFNNSGSSNNIAIGDSALFTQTNNSGQNIAVGSHVLYNNTTGVQNTAIGVNALFKNTSGGGNIATGTNALYTNSTGNYNTATGYRVMERNTTGFSNTATGDYALFSNTTGYSNTAYGSDALQGNGTGFLNTANGTYSLSLNSTGNYNTGYGPYTLYNNKTGNSNTAVGYYALLNLVAGSRNIAIGDNSGNAPGSPNVINTISIGNDGILNGANNQVFIGNLSTAYCGTNVSWSTFSDARIKTGITEEVKGLDFINRLRPVTYYKSIHAISTLTGNKESADFAGKYDIEKIKFSGFLAQEVEEAANRAGYEFSGMHRPENKNDLYALSYENFVVPLVKAVQEQQAIITNLQKQIDMLQKNLSLITATK